MTTCSLSPSLITAETISRIQFFATQISPQFSEYQVITPSSTSLSVDLDESPVRCLIDSYFHFHFHSHSLPIID